LLLDSFTIDQLALIKGDKLFADRLQAGCDKEEGIKETPGRVHATTQTGWTDYGM